MEYKNQKEVIIIFKRLNNKGVSYLDIAISLVVLVLLIRVVATFEISTTKSKQRDERAMTIIQTTNEIVTDAYNTKDWDNLGNKSIETRFGDITIIYKVRSEISTYSTKELEINITNEDYNKKIVLERSIYDK